jgi:hypothetical protein
MKPNTRQNKTTIAQLAKQINMTPQQIHYAIKKQIFPLPTYEGIFEKKICYYTIGQVTEIKNIIQQRQAGDS